MVRQVAGDGNITAIDRVAAGGGEGCDDPGFPVRLGVVFVSRVERAGPEGNPQDYVDGTGIAGAGKRSGLGTQIRGIEGKPHGQGSCGFEKGSSLHLAPPRIVPWS
jgi:hypothetical protein